jgi:drug efflux transport system permease protein
MLRRIWAITQKEFIQLLREPIFTVLIVFGTLAEVILLAVAIHTDIRHIPMVVADQSVSQESRAYIHALVDGGYFDTVANVSGRQDILRAIDAGQANLGILIPPDFASQVKLHQASVLMLVDGSSSYVTRSAYGTANAITQAYDIDLIREPVNPLNMDVRVLYNPDMQDLWFIIPGLLAALVQGVALNMTTLVVVREREVGTIEALLVTPIRPIELMLGKTIPNLLITLAVVVENLVFTVLVFGLPFRGSLLLFFALATVFCFSGLGLGLVISVVVQNQLQAQLLGMMVNFGGFFLAGMLFPVYALPPALRLLSYLFPATYFLPITRAIMIKGVGLDAIWGDAVGTCILMVLIVFAAARLFRQSLD